MTEPLVVETASPELTIPRKPEASSVHLPDPLMQIPVTVQVVLGSTMMQIGQIAELKRGDHVSLDQELGSPVTILINGRQMAKGELFVLDGEGAKLAVTITELQPANL